MIFGYRSPVRGMLVTLFVIGCLSFSSLTFAQSASTSTEDSQTVAREQYQRGKELYDAGDYTEALKAFQTAYDAKPHPVVLKSIAECKVLLGDISGAIVDLERFLQDPEAKGKIAVENRIVELKKMTIAVEVNSNPAGAAIAIDGRDTGKATPSTLYMGPGEYELTLTVADFEPLSKKVTLQAGVPGELAVDFPTEGVSTKPVQEQPLDTLAEEEQTDEVVEEDEGGHKIPAGFWVAAAFTGAGLVSGTVFGALALGTEDDYLNEPTQSTKDKGELQAILADVSFGVAAAAAITGVTVLLVYANKKESNDSSARLFITPVAGTDVVGINAKIDF